MGDSGPADSSAGAGPAEDGNAPVDASTDNNAPAGSARADKDPAGSAADAASGPARQPLSGPRSDAGGSPDGPSGRPDAPPLLAGRADGVGRLRPGRPFSPWELTHRDDFLGQFDQPPPSAAPSAAPVAVPRTTTASDDSRKSGRAAPQALDRPGAHHMQQVSLGVGIALVGLGLGFLGLRIRRTN
ncbi:hypothetical protein [Streptomyces sp. NBC_00316]|uniref:hypothetical protein n=1 Tax=Streptomyces sp. NBC_00316 TaxID=2975710 RepID=UPI002E2D4757|nr:hypothetical protein [Streptomyces sp. NBC_00316]